MKMKFFAIVGIIAVALVVIGLAMSQGGGQMFKGTFQDIEKRTWGFDQEKTKTVEDLILYLGDKGLLNTDATGQKYSLTTIPQNFTQEQGNMIEKVAVNWGNLGIYAMTQEQFEALSEEIKAQVTTDTNTLQTLGLVTLEQPEAKGCEPIVEEITTGFANIAGLMQPTPVQNAHGKIIQVINADPILKEEAKVENMIVEAVKTCGVEIKPQLCQSFDENLAEYYIPESEEEFRVKMVEIWEKMHCCDSEAAYSLCPVKETVIEKEQAEPKPKAKTKDLTNYENTVSILEKLDMAMDPVPVSDDNVLRAADALAEYGVLDLFVGIDSMTTVVEPGQAKSIVVFISGLSYDDINDIVKYFKVFADKDYIKARQTVKMVKIGGDQQEKPQEEPQQEEAPVPFDMSSFDMEKVIDSLFNEDTIDNAKPLLKEKDVELAKDFTAKTVSQYLETYEEKWEYLKSVLILAGGLEVFMQGEAAGTEVEGLDMVGKALYYTAVETLGKIGVTETAAIIYPGKASNIEKMFILLKAMKLLPVEKASSPTESEKKDANLKKIADTLAELNVFALQGGQNKGELVAFMGTFIFSTKYENAKLLIEQVQKLHEKGYIKAEGKIDNLTVLLDNLFESVSVEESLKSLTAMVTLKSTITPENLGTTLDTYEKKWNFVRSFYALVSLDVIGGGNLKSKIATLNIGEKILYYNAVKTLYLLGITETDEIMVLYPEGSEAVEKLLIFLETFELLNDEIGDIELESDSELAELKSAAEVLDSLALFSEFSGEIEDGPEAMKKLFVYVFSFTYDEAKAFMDASKKVAELGYVKDKIVDEISKVFGGFENVSIDNYLEALYEEIEIADTLEDLAIVFVLKDGAQKNIKNLLKTNENKWDFMKTGFALNVLDVLNEDFEEKIEDLSVEDKEVFDQTVEILKALGIITGEFVSDELPKLSECTGTSPYAKDSCVCPQGKEAKGVTGDATKFTCETKAATACSGSGPFIKESCVCPQGKEAKAVTGDATKFTCETPGTPQPTVCSGSGPFMKESCVCPQDKTKTDVTGDLTKFTCETKAVKTCDAYKTEMNTIETNMKTSTTQSVFEEYKKTLVDTISAAKAASCTVDKKYEDLAASNWQAGQTGQVDCAPFATSFADLKTKIQAAVKQEEADAFIAILNLKIDEATKAGCANSVTVDIMTLKTYKVPKSVCDTKLPNIVALAEMMKKAKTEAEFTAYKLTLFDEVSKAETEKCTVPIEIKVLLSQPFVAPVIQGMPLLGQMGQASVIKETVISGQMYPAAPQMQAPASQAPVMQQPAAQVTYVPAAVPAQSAQTMGLSYPQGMAQVPAGMIPYAGIPANTGPETYVYGLIFLFGFAGFEIYRRKFAQK